MITELMWKSFDRLSAAYWFLWPMPLEWNRRSRKLVHNSFSWKMAPWTIGMLFLFLFEGIPCLALLSLSLFGVADVPLKVMVITVIFLMLCTYGIVQNLGAILYGANFVTGFNFLEAMDKEMSRKSRKRC